MPLFKSGLNRRKCDVQSRAKAFCHRNDCDRNASRDQAILNRRSRRLVPEKAFKCRPHILLLPRQTNHVRIGKAKKPSEPLARIYWWNGFAAIPDGEGHHGQSTNGSRDKVERQLVHGHIEEARAYEHDGAKDDHHQDGIHYIVRNCPGWAARDLN